MNNIKQLKTKIEQIERLLAEVKNELETLFKENQSQLKNIGTEDPPPSEETLKAEYERLYEEFTVKNSKEVIEEFIKGKNKDYLKAFCKANNVPLDTTKVSKIKIAAEVAQWMVQRKAITK